MHELRAIPLWFVDRFGPLTWPEVQLGMREAWLDAQSAVDIAIRNVVAGTDNSDEIALAGLLRGELIDAAEIVSRLAGRTLDDNPEEPRMTWLRLLLAWIYENRSSVSDPFDVIERLYADFGYPEEVRHLARYSETTRSVESKADARKQMEEAWADYVRSISLRGSTS